MQTQQSILDEIAEIEAANAAAPGWSSIGARSEHLANLRRELEWLGPAFNLPDFLARQRVFSEKTFGPGARSKGVVDHIRRELVEVEAAPGDLKEWIDIVTLALDGAWRAGFSPAKITAQLEATLRRNMARKWPDWRTADPDKAIEHDRSHDVAH